MEHFYREFVSPPDLRQWVDCLWIREAAMGEGQDQSPHTHLVLPDGCIDILFELADPRAGASFVVGMMTKSLHVRRTGRMSIIAVRFRPSGAARFFREPLANLTDARVALGELWHGSGSIAERLAERPTASARMEVLASELRSRLQPVRSSRLAACQAAVACISREPGIRIAAVCKQIGISRQALAAAFREYVGVSPKLLGRVLRLQRALRLASLPAPRPVSWAWVSHDAGFYDQAHLVNEVRALTGMAPQSLLAQRGLDFPIFQD